jgi:(R,R)-butanediol dehydrogenase / meso-butanediol dehydrogenase / diacetyl reductase
MKAGLVTAPRQFELVDMPDPVVKPGTAVVDVHLCGICGTDVHGFLGPGPYNPSICGHELVGTVAAVGAGVTHLDEGERVVLGIAEPCGRCPNCEAGRPRYCIAAFLGMVGRDELAPPHGGFARSVLFGAARLIAANPALSDEQAAVVEPATVAVHAVNRTPPADLTVVQGCGPIGLLTLQVALAKRGGHVVAVEPSEHRRAIALAVGAH